MFSEGDTYIVIKSLPCSYKSSQIVLDILGPTRTMENSIITLSMRL
uniref:Uncharacterized protein n=1 Tax=Lepeophtheirus salmonis TaxID=72036 RepID=A0A0K2UJT0_LEPSM